MTIKKRLAAASLPLLLALAVSPAHADTAFPSKQIRFVVPYAPGGFTDTLARLISQKMSQDLDQTVIVDNRPGGGSTIGTHYVARAEPDGHTILLISSNFTINDTLLRNINYDAAKDFAPVSIAANSPMVLVTNPKSGINSVKQLIDLSKEKPGTLNYGSGGNGTGAHLTMELLKSESGLDIMHIPYKGHGPATTALLSGEVAAIFLQMGNALPQIEAGKLKALAVPHIHRSPQLPEVPTIAEEVLPGFDVIPWFGVVAPAGTPQKTWIRSTLPFIKPCRTPTSKPDCRRVAQTRS